MLFKIMSSFLLPVVLLPLLSFVEGRALKGGGGIVVEGEGIPIGATIGIAIGSFVGLCFLALICNNQECGEEAPASQGHIRNSVQDHTSVDERQHEEFVSDYTHALESAYVMVKQSAPQGSKRVAHRPTNGEYLFTLHTRAQIPSTVPLDPSEKIRFSFYASKETSGFCGWVIEGVQGKYKYRGLVGAGIAYFYRCKAIPSQLFYCLGTFDHGNGSFSGSWRGFGGQQGPVTGLLAPLTTINDIETGNSDVNDVMETTEFNA